MELTSLLLPYATAFGLALLHSLWIGTVLYVGVRAWLPLLKRPAQRYHLAYGALLTLAAVFCATLYWVYDPAPTCENLLLAGQPLDGLHLLAAAQATTELGWTEWLRQQVPAVAPWLSVGYFAGLLPAIFVLLRDHHQSRHLRRYGLWELPPAWTDALHDELDRHVATRRVQCYLSERGGEVMTLGFWSPVIVFPVALVNELSPEMARTILLHEIAHLRHYDHWLNYPQQFLRAFFFFHPAVHALCRLIDQEREHRCDDWVAARCADRRTYASALVTVARTSHTPKNNLVMSATKTPFSHRIQRLFLGDDHRNEGNYAFSILLIILLGAAHLGYVNLGADASANNCLEEQAKAKTAVLAPRPPAQPTEQATLLTVDTTHLTTNPPNCSPTKLPAPFIAAPEPPESSSPWVQEQYERARLKYAAIRQLTGQQPALKTNSVVAPLATTQRLPNCVTSMRRDTTPPATNNRSATPSPGEKPATRSPVKLHNADKKIAIFVDGELQENGTVEDLDAGRIESVEITKSAEQLAAMGLTGYSGAIKVTTKKASLAPAPKPTVGQNNFAPQEGQDIVYLLDGEVTDLPTINALAPARIKAVNVIKGKKQVAKAGYPGKDGVIVVKTVE